MDGFYVPSSISSSYISSKRDESGEFQYDALQNRIGLSEQAALQSLKSQYATTIENAYASYLTSQKNVMTSAMGEGYKEAYQQNLDKMMTASAAEAGLSLQSAKAEIMTQAGEAKQQVEKVKETEIAYMNRVSKSFDDYLTYVKSLTKDELTGSNLLSQMTGVEDIEGLTVDDLYGTLYSLPVFEYKDTKGEAGLSYSQWVQKNLTTSSTDTDWANWLFYGGGLQQFSKATETLPDDNIKGRLKVQEENKTDTLQKEYEAAKWSYSFGGLAKPEYVEQFDKARENYFKQLEQSDISDEEKNRIYDDYIQSEEQLYLHYKQQYDKLLEKLAKGPVRDEQHRKLIETQLRRTSNYKEIKSNYEKALARFEKAKKIKNVV